MTTTAEPSTAVVLPHSDVPLSFDQQMRMAEILAASTLLPKHLRGQPANVLVVMQGARALNIPAFWAFQSLHVIEGRLSMAADLMRALVLAAGHTFRVVERTRERAVVEIHRKDRDTPYRADYTYQEAVEAKLVDKANWKGYRRAMLVARATGIAVRDECPEVLFGVLYTPDELGVDTDGDGNPVRDPRVIDMPDPDRTTDYFHVLSTLVSTDAFADTWAEIVDKGWALESPPGTDMSLFDRAVCTLHEVIGGADIGQLRELWTLAARTDLISQQWAGVALGDEILARKAELEADQANRDRELVDLRKAMDHAHEKATITPEQDQAFTELVQVGDEIQTEHARRLQADAEASWTNEGGTDG